MLVNPLMANRYTLFHLDPAHDLLRTPFRSDQYVYKLPDLTADTGPCLVVTPRHCQVVGLLGPVALESPVAPQLPADGRFITFQQPGNLCLAIFGFLQDVNLVSFLLGKLRIASHVCSSYLAVRKATMLTQLALLPSDRVALTN